MSALPHTCTYLPDTYKFARNSGDKTFIHWIYMRLLLVYHENELYDYMHTLKAFDDGINDVVRDAARWNKLPRIIKWWYQ